MKKTMLKRILGLFVLIFVFTFISLPYMRVEAAEPKLCKTKAIKEMDWAARYGIELDYDGDYYIITMNIPEATADAGVDKSKAKFKITGIVNYKPTYNEKTGANGMDTVDGTEKDDKTVLDFVEPKDGILKNKGKLKIKKSKLQYTEPGVQISLDPYKPDKFIDPTVESECGEGYTFHFDVGFESEGDPDTNGKMDEKWKVEEKDMEISEAINCDNYTTKFDKISFEYGFCEAKTGATKENKKEFAEKTVFSDKESMKFSCNPNDLIVPQDLANVADEDYYKNKKFIYGSTIKEVNRVTYRHNYENGAGVDTSDVAVCKLKCEEAVTVEYGPPIASKAAFCFQYKVKVTSRVSCAQAEGSKVKVPREDNYCTPSPYCVHSNGVVYNQGGPNEEFDVCVNNCDGGKYTSKCTKKCYNKVYKNSKKKFSKTAEDFEAELKVERLNGNDKTIDCSTCGSSCPNNHYCYNGTQIIWKNAYLGGTRGPAGKGAGCNTGNSSSSSCPENTDSRWHQTHYWGCSGGYSKYSATGIPRTATCTDVCSWIGCKSGKYYLNPDSLNEDAEWNKEQYEKLVRECKAAASCTNTTAYFTISVDYRNGEGKDVTYDFPYSNAKVVDGKITDGDKLTSKGEGHREEGTASKSNTTLIKNEKICTEENLKNNSKTWIRHYCSRGCYEADSEKDLYRAEWTFPGTWENLKSGEISYTPQDGGSWKSRPKYFCVPADAQNVNTKWWNYYYTKTYKSDTRFAANDKYYNQNISDTTCAKSCEYVLYAKNSFAYDEVEKWNIRALAKDFGYFAWNIDIKCFYALNNQGNDPICKEICKNKEKYRVRSVDLKNLFPGKEGQAVNYDTTGRSPGFNWSTYATQTNKDATYVSKPVEYTKWVQKKGNTVYEDANLDYMVTLDKASIQAIKNHLKNTGIKYTTYEGNIIDASNVSHYRSKLFTNASSYSLKNVVYPGTDALKCNNIGEHSTSAGYSASCYNYNE